MRARPPRRSVCLRSVLSLSCLACLRLAAGVAAADETPPVRRLSGRVTDVKSGRPVEGALVDVSGPGARQSATTDAAGRFSVALRPGSYTVLFVYGLSRTTGRVVIAPDRDARLDGRVDVDKGEVIVVRERRRPAVAPRPKNYSPTRAPPYSDRAIASDAWARAWLLLDVDRTGRVRRFKFLKRPGYDLERIAAREALRLRFEPGRDAAGRAVDTWVVWSIEWPAYWWLVEMFGVASRMPPTRGFPPRSAADRVPCAGSGPLDLGSLHPVYRDCSKPDLGRFGAEAWIATAP